METFRKARENPFDTNTVVPVRNSLESAINEVNEVTEQFRGRGF